MAKAKSWSVKGIDGETRDMARDAAQAAGLPIGAWIDRAILRARDGDIAGMAATETPRDAPTEKPADAAAPPPPAESPPPPTPETEGPAHGTGPSSGESPPVADAAGERSTETPDPGPRETVPHRRHIMADPETRLSARTPANSDRPPSTTDPADDPESGDQDFEPRPLAPPATRPSVFRYGIAAAILVVLLAGGAWVFVEMSSVDRPPLPRTVAQNPAPPAPGGGTPPARPTPNAPPAAGAAAADEVRTIVSLANAGDAKAQHDLGMLYLSGKHVGKDPAEAAAWFEKAAIQGLANAQFNLGVLYQRGEGVTRNDRLAFFWYQSAAEQGLARAQHNLATAYIDGRGTQINYPKGVEWLTKAADAGLSESQFSLASLYELGFATGEPDLEQARKWFERAAAQGDAQAPERLQSIEARIAARRESTPPPPAASTPPPAQTAVADSGPIGKNEIREIQTLLDAMNFNPGPIDGEPGRRTSDAIRLYQQFAGLESDGRISRELLEELRAVAATMSGKR